MSYAFEIAAERPPNSAEVYAGLGQGLVRCTAGGSDLMDGGLSLFLQGVSTRTTAVTWAEREIRVVVSAFACEEDMRLAVDVVETVTRLVGASVVQTEHFGEVGAAAIAELYGAEWMRRQLESNASVAATMIRNGHGPICIGGPLRSGCIGVRLLAELEAAGPVDELPTRLISKLRRIQWGLPERFRDAGIFDVAGKDGGKAKKVAFWIPEDDLVFPCVDYAVLRSADAGIIAVPFGDMAGLAGRQGVLVDECQLLLYAVPADEWSRILTRAAALAVPL